MGGHGGGTEVLRILYQLSGLSRAERTLEAMQHTMEVWWCTLHSSARAAAVWVLAAAAQPLAGAIAAAVEAGCVLDISSAAKTCIAAAQQPGHALLLLSSTPPAGGAPAHPPHPSSGLTPAGGPTVSLPHAAASLAGSMHHAHAPTLASEPAQHKGCDLTSPPATQGCNCDGGAVLAVPLHNR